MNGEAFSLLSVIDRVPVGHVWPNSGGFGVSQERFFRTRGKWLSTRHRPTNSPGGYLESPPDDIPIENRCRYHGRDIRGSCIRHARANRSWRAHAGVSVPVPTYNAERVNRCQEQWLGSP